MRQRDVGAQFAACSSSLHNYCMKEAPLLLKCVTVAPDKWIDKTLTIRLKIFNYLIQYSTRFLGETEN